MPVAGCGQETAWDASSGSLWSPDQSHQMSWSGDHDEHKSALFPSQDTMEKDARIPRRLNAFLKHTKGKCPIIAYFEPIVPAVKCAIEHRLVSGVAYWATYEGHEVANNFVFYQTGGRVPAARKRSKGPGGTKFTCGLNWDEMVREGEPTPIDAPVEHLCGVPAESVELIKKAGLFFYSFLAFDEGRIDSTVYLDTFGDHWIPGLLSEEDSSLYRHLQELHAKKPIADRDEAYEKAREYIRQHFEQKRPYGISGSSVLWYQGAAITKQKRWDHELATGNFQVQAAFLRGVSQQYDIPFIIYAAPWAYSPDGIFGMKADSETPFGKVLNCPAYAAKETGKPDHLLEREWYFGWFSGAAALVLESMQLRLFKQGKDKGTFEPGQIADRVRRLNHLAFESDFDRGVPYRPACILMDERHGWDLPRSPDAIYDKPMMQRRKIWGVFDHTDEDVMVDNFLGAIYPGYETGGSCGSPGGELTPTPYGESFDVLMSNATAEALAKYSVVFPLGRPKLTQSFKRRLEDYVANGGDLVLNISQVDYDWRDFLGVTLSPKHNLRYTALGALRVSDYSEWLEPVQLWRESRYRYVRVEATDREVLAVTEQGDPLVICHRHGRGRVYLVTAQFMQEVSGLHRPNGLLKISRHLIGHVLEARQRMRVRGPALHYMVNETSGGLSVMLLNNKPELWSGWVTFPRLAGAAVREWFEGERLHVHSACGDLSIRLAIPSYSLRILSVTGRPAGDSE